MAKLYHLEKIGSIKKILFTQGITGIIRKLTGKTKKKSKKKFRSLFDFLIPKRR